MTKPIDRAEMKAQTRKLLQTAQVSPKGMTALYCICLFLLSLMEALFPGPELVSTFLSILTTLAGWILAAGFALYCMDIRRRERSEYAVLFDGFSFTGKIIALNIVINCLCSCGPCCLYSPASSPITATASPFIISMKIRRWILWRR